MNKAKLGRDMLRGHLVVLVSVGFLLAGCATALKPVSLSEPAGCAGTGLQKSICQADKKAELLTNAYFEWYNQPALFDIPLIALASAAAGLLIFDAHADALKGVGLGAATVGALRQYLDPKAVRSALLDGTNGYSCLVDAGEELLLGTKDWSDRRKMAGSLRKFKTLLEIYLAGTPAAGFDRERAVRAKDKAEITLGLFDKQDKALKSADRRFRSAARQMSTGLLKRIERQDVDFDAVFKALAEKALAVAQYKVDMKQAEPGTTDPGLADPDVADNESIRISRLSAAARDAALMETVVKRIESLIAEILKDLPNVEENVAIFGECAATALAGATPTT